MATPVFSSFSYQNLADKLHALRERLDGITPGASSVLNGIGSVVGGPAMWAIQGAMQPDILPAKAPQTSPQILPTQPMPPVQGLDLPATPTASAPQAAPQAPSVPMPMPRPASAPQAPAPSINPNGSISGAVGPTSVGGAPLQPQQPDTSFFMRNALMMHDPSTGQLIDPQGASTVRGPDLINKMLTYLHNKQPTGSVGNNNDPSTWGSG